MSNYKQVSLRTKAFEKVVFDQMVKDFKEDVKKRGYVEVALEVYGKLTGPDQEVLKDMEDRELERNVGPKAMSSKTIAVMVTFSHSKIPLSVLRKLASSVLKVKKGVKRVLLVFEQTGESEEEIGQHPHIHFILELDKENQASEYAKIKRYITGKFSKWIESNHTLHFSPIFSEKKLQDKIEYIKGNKKEEDKAKRSEIDKKWRELVNLDDIYIVEKSEN